MDALREATLAAGKFAWQLLWTGGSETSVGDTCPHALVTQPDCAANLRSLCNETAPPQTRAMMYALEVRQLRHHFGPRLTWFSALSYTTRAV